VHAIEIFDISELVIDPVELFTMQLYPLGWGLTVIKYGLPFDRFDCSVTGVFDARFLRSIGLKLTGLEELPLFCRDRVPLVNPEMVPMRL
jgi:hypothetical protein